MSEGDGVATGVVNGEETNQGQTTGGQTDGQTGGQSQTPQGFEGILKSDGTFVENWHERLGEDYKGSAVLKNFTTLEGLAKSLVNAQKLVGKKSLAYNDLDDEGKAQLLKDMGVPDNPDEYGFQKPEGVDDWDEQGDKWFAEKAKELGMTKTQAAKLREEYAQYQRSRLETMNASMEEQNEKALIEGEKQLRDAWKLDYDKNMALAVKTVDNLGLKEFATETGLASNPNFIAKMAEVGQAMGEDRLIDVGRQAAGKMSIEEAKEQLEEIKANRAYAIDPTLPEHSSLVRKAQKLFAIIHGAE